MVMLSIAGLVFLLLVLSPPLRLVGVDGFTALLQGELLARGQLGGSRARIDESVRALTPLASQRRETVPMPREFHAAERTDRISARAVEVDRGRDGRFYLPRSWNGRAFYAVARVSGLPWIVTVLIILPLIVLLAMLLGESPAGKASRWPSIALLIMFNPLILFYTYQGPTGDCLNGLLAALCLIVMLRSVGTTSEGPDGHDGTAVRTTGTHVGNVLAGSGLTVVIAGNPDLLPLILAVFFWCLARSLRSEHRLVTALLSVFAGSIVTATLMVLVAATMFGDPWSIIGLHHGTLFGGTLLHREPGAGNNAPLLMSLLRNVYLFVRTCLLAMPVLLPALLAMVVERGREDHGTMSGRLLPVVVLAVASLPVILGDRPEFAHYLLTGKNMIVAVPFLTAAAVHWLHGLADAERRTWSGLLVLIGVASYAFFLARMRLDFLSSGLMEALDRNYTRMYLVFQYRDLFP